MRQPDTDSDGVLTTEEWEDLLCSVPPRLAQLVARLARQHGFRRAGRKCCPVINHDAARVDEPSRRA